MQTLTQNTQTARADVCTTTIPGLRGSYVRVWEKLPATSPADLSTSPIVKRIMAERFANSTPRSLAYKLGMRAALENRLHDMPFSEFPYVLGDAAADAYLAGCAEGKVLACKYRDEVPA